MKNIYIIGYGDNTRVIIDTIFEINNKEQIYNLLGVYDDKIITNEYRNIKYIDYIQKINNIKDNNYYICGISNINIRNNIITKLDKINWINIIHPQAYISPTVKLGVGIFININSVLNSGANIGNHIILNTGSIIEHDVTIKENCNISPRVTICGHVTIGENTFIGVGSIIIDENRYGYIKIGKNNFLNAGSLIVHSTVDNFKVKSGH